MADAVEVAAHFDGERVVLDEPVDLKAGTRVRVSIREESEEERKARQLAALKRFSGSGKGLPQLESRYIDERDSYYE